MATRRMFSKTIIDSDEFLEMPVSARLLYYDLGMRADDDGFVSPKRIMRITNSTEDDLKVLLAKKYILNFENKVLVIRDWKVNNFIRPDRYTPTIYQEYLKRLELTNSNQYQIQSGIPDDIPDGGIGKVRLGKVRLGKDTISKEIAVADSSSYGNPDINTLMSFLKESLGGSPDGSQRDNRRFCKLLLDRFKKDYPDKNPVDLIQFLISAGLKDEFHSKNLTNFKYIYYNAQKIIASIKGRKRNNMPIIL